jgi:hypothetical protein
MPRKTPTALGRIATGALALARALSVLACVTFALPANADTNFRGRSNFPAHEAYKGLRLPTYAGTCTAVAGQQEGDVCWDSTNDIIYVYTGSAFAAAATGSYSLAAQALPTFDPAGTTDAEAALYYDVTAYESNEKVFATSAGVSIDEDGDVVIPAAGSLASAGRATFSKNPADTTAANASVVVTVSGHAANEKALAVGSVATIDAEGDAVVVGLTASGTVAMTGQVTVSKDPADTTAANASLLCDVSGHESNELCFATSDSAFKVDEDGDLTALTLTLGSTLVTATPAELNKLSGAAIGTHTISCADDAAGTTSLCTIQLVNAAGADMAVRTTVLIYLSDDATCDSIVGTAPSGGWVVTTDGLLMTMITNKAAWFTSESDGDIDFTITEAGAKTLYVCLVDPLGRIIASAADVFN